VVGDVAIFKFRSEQEEGRGGTICFGGTKKKEKG